MDQESDIGFWELSIIMVVITSWILYRYVAPKGWKEWSRAGLVQAFIIALYEVYRQSVPMFFPRQGEWKKLMFVGRFRESEK